MDAATAALIGATLGMSGAIAASVITTGRSRQLKREDRRQEAYANGMQRSAQLLMGRRADWEIQPIFEAWGHIKLVGSTEAADTYEKFMFEISKAIGDPTYEPDYSGWLRFQEVARRDVGAELRRWPRRR